MKLEELELIRAPCEWNIARTSLVHGVIGWFTITLGTPAKMFTMCTGPWNEWTHWHQGRMLVEEALAVNSGQKLVCDFEMKNNAVMSYDARLKLSLPGTDIVRENPNISLLDSNSEFQKCIRVYGRVVGVPYDSPPNFIPEYVKQWYARQQQAAAFTPAPRTAEQPNGAVAQPNGAHVNGVGMKQEPIMHFGQDVMVPAQGEFAKTLAEQAQAGKCVVVVTHQGRQFLAPGGDAKQGVVEIVPAAVAGAAPQATWYWMPQASASQAAA